jgi:sec-independent protein translocase protein TatC
MNPPTSDSDHDTLGAHLEALRGTLIRVLVIIGLGCLGSFASYSYLNQLLVHPFSSLHMAQPLVVLGPAEGLNTAIKVSFWFGLTLTSPFWIWVILRFVQPALKAHERRAVLPFLVVSGVLMSVGLLFAYFVTIPVANQYLSAFNGTIGQNLWSLSHYMDYTILLLLANALAFEIAALFLMLIHTGWISAQWLIEHRRVMIVCIFVLSALLTPPDVLTQLFMAIPLLFLYECLVLYARRLRNLFQSFD